MNAGRRRESSPQNQMRTEYEKWVNTIVKSFGGPGEKSLKSVNFVFDQKESAERRIKLCDRSSKVCERLEKSAPNDSILSSKRRRNKKRKIGFLSSASFSREIKTWHRYHRGSPFQTPSSLKKKRYPIHIVQTLFLLSPSEIRKCEKRLKLWRIGIKIETDGPGRAKEFLGIPEFWIERKKNMNAYKMQQEWLELVAGEVSE